MASSPHAPLGRPWVVTSDVLWLAFLLAAVVVAGVFSSRVLNVGDRRREFYGPASDRPLFGRIPPSPLLGDRRTALSGAPPVKLLRTPVELPQIPVMVTSASGPITVGAALSDTAFLSGGDRPTGTITFRAFGPSDPTCAGGPGFVSTVPVDGAGAYRSAAFSPRRPGVYQWLASYSGDARNEPRTDVCPTGDEASTVLFGAPSLVTPELAPVPVGVSIFGVAILAGGSKPGGTLVFRAFGPDDRTCAGLAVYTSPPINVAGDGTYSSGPYNPTVAGTYQFEVVYSGDAQNLGLRTRCDDASQAVVVTPGAVSVVAQPAPPTSVGDTIVSRGTLSGGRQPTGSITFEIFGPNDASCTGPPTFTSSATPVSDEGEFASPPFTPAAPGTYTIVATYNGDINNASQKTTCGAPNQTVTVSRAIPSIAAEPAGAVFVGQQVAAAESVSGGHRPTGTMSFAFYPPEDPTCTGRPFFSSPSQPISGAGTYRSPPFTATTPGNVRFVAAYSGDDNNISFTTDCNANDQALLVVLSGLYKPSDHPRSVIELEVLVLALVALAGSAGVDGMSVTGRTSPDAPTQDASAPGRVVSTGIDNTAEGWEALVVLDAAVIGRQTVKPVDRSRVLRWPGTKPLDELSVKVPPRVAPASPLMARIANDAGYLRAIFGSASTLLPFAGVTLAIVAVIDVRGHALPPPFLIAMAIAVLGVLDAFAGLVAVAVFVAGVIASGGLSTANDARMLLGLSSLWFAAPIIAGVARPLRRAPTRSTAEHVERLADVIVAALVGAWATKQIIEGLPGLSGKVLPIAGHANVAAITVLTALALRMVVETVAAHRYPTRLCEVQAAALPVSGRAQHLASAIVALAVFLFVALPYIGACWQLYVGGAFFAIPVLLRLWSDRFPNFPRLYAVIPRGVLRTVVMLVVGTVLGAFVAGRLHDQNHRQIIRESFVILSIPGLVISLLQIFGRQGPGPPRIHWLPEKLLGAVLVATGILFVVGAIKV
ncbi:MAG: hypothetical protein QOF81_801 [Acidimicrobiaceae bacterium]|nr:hypothetical protein [Acidimicrobiaceae bacterium]